MKNLALWQNCYHSQICTKGHCIKTAKLSTIKNYKIFALNNQNVNH